MENQFKTELDNYFLGQVAITITPFRQYNYTECEVTVRYTPEQQKEMGPSYTWNVNIDTYIDSPFEALQELKKDKYWTAGSSETID